MHLHLPDEFPRRNGMKQQEGKGGQMRRRSSANGNGGKIAELREGGRFIEMMGVGAAKD
jgi:hypothetical protein